MEEQEYIKAYEIEETNWYFVTRRNFFFRILDKYIKNKNNKILDVGSGTGVILKELERYGNVQGTDFSEKAINFCRLRGLQCLYTNAEDIPFKKESFDLVTAFGLIEHVDDDEKVLREISRVCKREGFVILECPAYKFLWSQHDVALHHKRRYTIKELKGKLSGVNLIIEKISYIYCFILIPAIFFRFCRKIMGKKEAKSDPFEKLPLFLNKLFIKIENLEVRLINNFRIPFGISIVCLARKK